MSSLVLFLFYLIRWPDTHIPGNSNRKVQAETCRVMEELCEKGDIMIKTYLGRRSYSAFWDLGNL